MFVAFALLLLASGARPDKVIGGTAVTSTSTAPWQASLQRFGSHFCGGSVISSINIMTACHCHNSFVDVITGTVDLQDTSSSIAANTFVCHSSYTSFPSTNYDYAIITLQSSLTLEDGVVEVITVPTQDYPAGTPALLTGWGLTDGSSNTLPRYLQQATLNLVSQGTCQSIWGTLMIKDQMQCAYVENNAGGCNGDSGGPLAVNDNGTWMLVGNVSWGLNGCSTANPTVFSKNAAVYDWISGIAYLP